MDLDKYKDYANKVLSGEIVSGELVKLCCRRYLSWFEREDMEFIPRKVDHVVNFIHLLKHFDGKYRGKHFDLQDWQFFFICGVYGWYWKRTGKRVIHSAYLQIARKSGKTALSSALCLYALIADNEPGAEVYLLAPSRAQAAIAYRMSTYFAESINRQNVLKCLRNAISYDKKKALLKVFSPDAKFGDGFSPHFALCDEYHLFSNNDALNALRSGMGARENPIMMCITTAGRDLYAPCYEYRNMCVRLLHGEIEDDSLFPLVYEMDSDGEIENEKNWKKACPSLGITVSEDYLRERVVFAKNNPSERVDVLTKNFDIWVDNALGSWIDNEVLRKHSKKFSLVDIVNECENVNMLDCYVAVDLAATRDLTAVSALVPYKDKLYIKNWCFLPETAIETAGKNKQLYQEAIDSGFMIVTPGNTTDYDYVSNLIVEINNMIPVTKIAYDRALCNYWATRFEEQYDMPMYQYSQGLFNFTVPTHEMERMMYSHEDIIVLDDNPLVRWQFSNVIIKQDYIGNCKPTKDYKSSSKKIDNVITSLMCLGTYMLDNNNGSWAALSIQEH